MVGVAGSLGVKSWFAGSGSDVILALLVKKTFMRARKVETEV